jgi:hypothetical protein
MMIVSVAGMACRVMVGCACWTMWRQPLIASIPKNKVASSEAKNKTIAALKILSFMA